MIQKLKVKNFKCFDNFEFVFSDLNLLTGINGMGKSSLLQILLLLNESYHKSKLEGLLLENDYVTLGFPSNVYCDYPVEPEKEIYFELEFCSKEKIQLRFEVNLSHKINYLKLINKNNTQKLFEESLFKPNKFKYLNTERISPSTIFKQSDYKIQEKDFVGSHGELTVNYLLAKGNQNIENKNLFPEQEDRKLINLVTQWMNEIRPGFKLSFLESNLNTGFLEMKYSFVKNFRESSSFTAPNVGFGITYTLPVVVALLSAKEDDILIIENPEAHLHPKGQSKLGELISHVANSNVQLFIETHSEHILNGMRVAIMEKIISKEKVKIFFFQDSKEKSSQSPEVLVPQIKEDARLIWSEELGYNWPDGFFDEWDKNIDKLMGL
ncbi:MAG: DUF3696 domain-containing protein [Leptospiraceae bacterium]|nr:DUF3696 domain-containing protein [Leptospiraceae bacterium]